MKQQGGGRMYSMCFIIWWPTSEELSKFTIRCRDWFFLDIFIIRQATKGRNLKVN